MMTGLSATAIFKNIFPDYARGLQHMRVNTLIRLRWLAIIGQTITVVAVQFGFGFSLPFVACLIVIAASALLNIVLTIRLPVNYRLAPSAATKILAFDIVQLAGLLYLTGGLENPFAVLFLSPVLVSATALSPERTLILGLLAVGCATILALVHDPLPWNASVRIELPFLYVSGIWFSLFLSMAFISIYAWQVAAEARQLADALAAMELVLEREQHLSQLDGLAAAAAHELGTPLATIALVAKELSRSLPQDDDTAADLQLLRDQVVRCREILGKLTSLGREDNMQFLATMTLRHLIEETVAPLRSLDVLLNVDIDGKGPEPRCLNRTALMFSLTNIIDNAIDFAGSEVWITARWDDDHVRLEIRDDGPGYAPDILMRLGEPYVTTRAVNRNEHKVPEEGATGGGLGLGLFIAKTLIERSGAEMVFSNATLPATGAITRITWRRADFEHDVEGVDNYRRAEKINRISA